MCKSQRIYLTGIFPGDFGPGAAPRRPEPGVNLSHLNITLKI
jgi:hypothetical protein